MTHSGGLWVVKHYLFVQKTEFHLFHVKHLRKKGLKLKNAQQTSDFIRLQTLYA